MKMNFNYLIPYIVLVTGAGILACTAAVTKSGTLEQPILNAASIGVVEAGYFRDIGEYKTEVEEQLKENEVRMIIFKGDLEREGKSGNSYYINLIKDLEQKSRDLEDKLKNYDPGDADGWEDFRNNLDAELEQLSYEYRSLGIRKTN